MTRRRESTYQKVQAKKREGPGKRLNITSHKYGRPFEVRWYGEICNVCRKFIHPQSMARYVYVPTEGAWPIREIRHAEHNGNADSYGRKIKISRRFSGAKPCYVCHKKLKAGEIAYLYLDEVLECASHRQERNHRDSELSPEKGGHEQ